MSQRFDNVDGGPGDPRDSKSVLLPIGLVVALVLVIALIAATIVDSVG